MDRGRPPLSTGPTPAVEACGIEAPHSSPAATVRPLGDSLNRLSGYMMCSDAEELRARAGWQGASGGSRDALLRQLSQCIPPSLMVPEGRLQTLLQQALQWQSARASGSIPAIPEVGMGRSLLEDTSLSCDNLPCETRYVLERHADEVCQAPSTPGTVLACRPAHLPTAPLRTPPMLTCLV